MGTLQTARLVDILLIACLFLPRALRLRGCAVRNSQSASTYCALCRMAKKNKHHNIRDALNQTGGTSNISGTSSRIHSEPPSSLPTKGKESHFLRQPMGQLSLAVMFSILLFFVTRVIHSQLKADILSVTRAPTDPSEVHPFIPESHSERTINSERTSHLSNKQNPRLPPVFIGVLVRNKAHSLPYILRGLETQDYPKSRIKLMFLTDNSIDRSLHVLARWIEAVKDEYSGIELEIGGSELEHSSMWSSQHFKHVIHLRQRLLEAARKSWAEFYFSLDADVVLMNNHTLSYLVQTCLHPEHSTSSLDSSLPILAPLLNCTSSEFYSNFWGAMTEHGYYKRSEDYFDIQRRHKRGVYPVPMVHTAFLVNLQHHSTERISFQPPHDPYDGPLDDLILFARSAQMFGAQFYLDNTQFYGYFPAPVEEGDLLETGTPIERWLAREQELFLHLRLQAIIDQEDQMRVLPSRYLEEEAQSQLPTPSKLGFDEVYYINLDRRTDRRAKMEYLLKQLGIAARHVSAVDGQALDTELISKMGVQQLKGYADPYHKRSLKYGEIGCFLSHYRLWEEMLERGYQRILILEDDVRFSPGFVRNLAAALQEADTHKPDWELIYIGRKRMSKNETRVPHTTKLAYPDYTYWTLGYVLKKSGAKKLLAQNPLKKMVAVDEYLPIMFNRHPQQSWLEQFEPRNLVTLSTEPLLLEPQRYTGEKFYVSDTEDSKILGSF